MSKLLMPCAFLLLLHVSMMHAKCVTFAEKYQDAKQFIENGPWAGSFIYTDSDTTAYTMRFSDASDNPNDKITSKLIAAGKVNKTDGHLNKDGQVDRCFLDYEHKALDESVDNKVHPTQDPTNFTFCKPWAQRSCCRSEDVSETKFNKLFNDWYGMGGACGDISATCKKYLFEEQCFYDCEPAVGLYRKFRELGSHPIGHSSQVGPGADKSNKWQISGMPVQKAYVDAFFEACKNDYFCDFSSKKTCGSTTKAEGSDTTKAEVSDSTKTVTTHAIALLVVLCLNLLC